MAQLFSARVNAYLKLAALFAGLLFGAIAVLLWMDNLSPWATGQAQYVDQVVPFSHEHHVSGLGIDCRYCHASVETSSTAGMPATHTCMSCHSQLWTESEMLRPVRASYREGKPLHWRRVYKLPDYVYFEHSIHVDRGVACETCHGRVDQMPLVYQTQALTMKWCLDCHRDPAPNLRPQEFVFAFGYERSRSERRATGARLVEEHGIEPSTLDDCSICHR